MKPPDRASLRRRLIEAREALDDKTRRELTSAIERHLWRLLERIDPVSLGFCWPYRAEPDLTGMVANWLQNDTSRHAALPVIVDKDSPLRFRDWHPAALMEQDRHGIPTPIAGEFRHPEVVLVPVNGFDVRGYRLGYGGGYFDRTLAVLQPRPQTIGVGFELARLESIDPQPHDLPLDWIVTEAGIVGGAAGWTES